MPICKNRSIHTQFTTIRTRFVVSLCFGRAHTEISQQITKIKWNFTNWNEYVLQQLGECTWCMPIQLLRFRFCFGFVFGFFSRNYLVFFSFLRKFPVGRRNFTSKSGNSESANLPGFVELEWTDLREHKSKTKNIQFHLAPQSSQRNHFMSTKFTSRKENAFHFIDCSIWFFFCVKRKKLLNFFLVHFNYGRTWSAINYHHTRQTYKLSHFVFLFRLALFVYAI